jgi:hypothetical protein
MFEENVEWIFNQDCRDKKRTGNGIHGRAARLRKKESVKMPSEREPDKFQRKLILGAGPCFTTTLREMKLMGWLERLENKEWPTIEELRELPYEDGQKIYAKLRTLYTTADMYQGFKCSSAAISELSYHFQVARSGKQIIVGEQALEILRGFTENRQNQAQAKREKGGREASSPSEKPKRKYKARESKAPQIVEVQKETAVIKVQQQEEIAPNEITLVEVKKPEIDLLRISVKNIYSAEQIMAFLTRVQLFVEGQPNQFELSLTLQEKESLA